MRVARTHEPGGTRDHGGDAPERGVRETVLLSSEEGWELVRSTAKAGTDLLPVPMPREELGYILDGTVRLTALPEDYDPATIDLDEHGEVLGAGDSFAFSQGERVMIEVLKDLSFVYARPVREQGTAPPGCCA